MSFFWVCRVLSGRHLCDGPIPRPEESYRVCVSVSPSVIRCISNLYTYRVQVKEVRLKEVLVCVPVFMKCSTNAECMTSSSTVVSKFTLMILPPPVISFTCGIDMEARMCICVCSTVHTRTLQQ
jgi:hypothetical protein